MSYLSEAMLLDRIQQGDKTAFSFVFTTFYSDLVYFAFTFTHDKEAAEEIVQDIFVKFWENRQALTISTSLRSFLIRSTQNRCIDRIRHLKIQEKHQHTVLASTVLQENDTDHYILFSELQSAYEKALNLLPSEVAATFRLNRIEGLTYQEIADQLGISVRTVEVRIGKALQWLREKLQDFLIPMTLMLCWLEYSGL